MTMVSWPLDLPQCPVGGGWSYEPQDSRSFFEPEIGPPITAPNGTAIGATMALEFRMTHAQVAAFEGWYRADLGYGSKSFTIVDPMSRAPRAFKFAKSPYAVSPINGRMRRVICNLIRLS